MKKITAGILAFLLVLTMFGSEAFAITTAEKEQSYNTALEELESYMESPGDSQYTLSGIISVFESLNSFQYSRKFFYYAQIMKKIEDGEFDSRYNFYLDNLISDERFCKYLSEESDYPALGTPEMLQAYGAGRESQLAGNADEALACYQRCPGFFDSDTRAEKLYMDGLEQAYSRAIELMDQNKLEEAYLAFSECSDYRDSRDIMDYIEKELESARQTPAPTNVPAADGNLPGFDCTVDEFVSMCESINASASEDMWKQVPLSMDQLPLAIDIEKIKQAYAPINVIAAEEGKRFQLSASFDDDWELYLFHTCEDDGLGVRYLYSFPRSGSNYGVKAKDGYIRKGSVWSTEYSVELWNCVFDDNIDNEIVVTLNYNEELQLKGFYVVYNNFSLENTIRVVQLRHEDGWRFEFYDYQKYYQFSADYLTDGMLYQLWVNYGDDGSGTYTSYNIYTAEELAAIKKAEGI